MFTRINDSANLGLLHGSSIGIVKMKRFEIRRRTKTFIRRIFIKMLQRATLCVRYILVSFFFQTFDNFQSRFIVNRSFLKSTLENLTSRYKRSVQSARQSFLFKFIITSRSNQAKDFRGPQMRIGLDCRIQCHRSSLLKKKERKRFVVPLMGLGHINSYCSNIGVLHENKQ